MSHLKKVLHISESLHNTHELRQKIAEYTNEPANDIESYVAYSNIQDDVDSIEDIRVVIIFTTKRILEFPNSNTNIPRASYIPSPNTSFNTSVTLNDQVSFTQPSSSTPAPATDSLPSLVVSPPRTSSPPALEPSTMESPLPLNPEEVSSRRKRSIEEVFSVELPPAKRISRSKTKQNKSKSRSEKRKREAE